MTAYVAIIEFGKNRERSTFMSIFNDDRATFNQAASDFDTALSNSGLDAVLHDAFESGMDLDEIMYVVFTHTEKTVRRYIVQNQLKMAANKNK